MLQGGPKIIRNLESVLHSIDLLVAQQLRIHLPMQETWV